MNEARSSMETSVKTPSVETSSRDASSSRQVSSVHGPHPLSHEPRWIRTLAGLAEDHGVHPQTLVYAALIAAGVTAFLVPIGGMVRSGVGTSALVLATLCIPFK